MKKVNGMEEWGRRMEEMRVQKADMNHIIMNFLVSEGFVDAAQKFQQESGTDPEVDLASISERMAVRNAIQKGNVEEAIERVNDLNPEILDTNPGLFFRLQQQRLIELIRSGRVEEAIEFAQDELAPRGEENAGQLEELERTVALLAFEDGASSPVGDLLLPSQRQGTASELNAAILSSQKQDKEPKLPKLLKMLLWVQGQLDEKVLYPRINNLETGNLEPLAP